MEENHQAIQDYYAEDRPPQGATHQQQTVPPSRYPQQLFYHHEVYSSQQHDQNRQFGQQHRHQQEQQHRQQHHTFVDVNNVNSNQTNMQAFITGTGLMSCNSKSTQQESQGFVRPLLPILPKPVAPSDHATTPRTMQMGHQILGSFSSSQLSTVHQPTSGILKQELPANSQRGFITSQVSSWPSSGPSRESQTQMTFDHSRIEQQATAQSTDGASGCLQQDSSRIPVASEGMSQSKAASDGNTVVILSSGIVDDITKHLGKDKQSEVTDHIIGTMTIPETLPNVPMSRDTCQTAHKQSHQEIESRQCESSHCDGLPQIVHPGSNNDSARKSEIAQMLKSRKGSGITLVTNKTTDGSKTVTAAQRRRSNMKPGNRQRENLTKETQQESGDSSSEEEDEDGWVEDGNFDDDENDEEEGEEEEEEAEEEEKEDKDEDDVVDQESDISEIEMEEDEDDDDEEEEDLEVPPLPEGFWYKFSSSSDEEKAIVGVTAEEQIPAGKQFGPLDGKLVGEEEGCLSQSSWELCTKGNVLMYIEAGSDWLSHIQCAKRKEDQNMEALQLYGDIFFRTIKCIEPGSELRVFYSREYSKHVGFKTDLRELTFNSDVKDFSCSSCEIHYTNPKLMLRHIKLSHHGKSSSDLRPVVTWETRSQTEEIEQSLEKALRGKGRMVQCRDHPVKLGVNQNTGRRYSSNLSELVGHKTQSQIHVLESKESVKRSESGQNLQHRNHLVKCEEEPRLKVYTETGKELICATCGKTFATEGRLHAHTMFHKFTSGRLHECPICGEMLSTEYMLERHVDSHRKRMYQCQRCPKTYLSQHALYCHEQNAHTKKEKYYSCSMCPVKFRWKYHMKEHEKKHKNKRKQEREQQTEHLKQKLVNLESRTTQKRKMNKPSRVLQDLDVVVDEENGDTSIKDMLGKKMDYFQDPTLRFKCKYCPKRYSNDKRVRKHEREVHEDRGRYRCLHCPKQFVDRCRYDIHQLKHSTTDKLYKCTDCPRSFASESALKNHYGEHTGLKPFKCDLCGKGFGKRELVTAHKRRLHSVVELKFPCSSCNKRFANKWDLIKHERRHKGIRPHVCEICGKGFTAKHSLQLHVSGVHEKLRPYECEICGKKSSTNHHHNVHVLMHKRKGEDKPVKAENHNSCDDDMV